MRFFFILPDGERREVTSAIGTSLLEAAHSNGIPLEGACEASLACSTCHVILEDDVFSVLDPATEEEEDLLDLAPCLEATSRLGCQVHVTPKLEGREVRLPHSTVNFYVDGHVSEPH